jgi:hypothetical protein
MAKTYYSRYSKTEPPAKEPAKVPDKPPVAIKKTDCKPLDAKARIIEYCNAPGYVCPNHVIDGLYDFWDRSAKATSVTSPDESLLYVVRMLCKVYSLRHDALVVVVGKDTLLTNCIAGALQNERTVVTYGNPEGKAVTDKFEWNNKTRFENFTDKKSLRGTFKNAFKMRKYTSEPIPADVFIIDSNAEMFERVYPEAVLAGLIDAKTEVFFNTHGLADAHGANPVKSYLSRLELTLFVSGTIGYDGLVQVKLPEGFKLDKATIEDLDKL